jgi:nitric oxide reductase large subunit
LIATGWMQAIVVVLLLGFFVLGFLAYRTYTGPPPIPARVTDPAGSVLFTAEAVRAGQDVGPDYTADYLRGAALAAVSLPQLKAGAAGEVDLTPRDALGEVGALSLSGRTARHDG